MAKTLLKNIGRLIYTVYWYILLLVYHGFGLPFGIIILRFGLRKLTSLTTVAWVHSLFFMGGLKFMVKGLENIITGDKYLFIMNHSSFFDIHAVLAVKPDITWLSKKEVLNIPLIGEGLRTSGGIPIDRKNFSESMENAYKIVREAKPGFTLGIFPEGTRSLDGKLQRFKRGFVRILRNCDLNLVPITLNGFYEFKPKKRRTFHYVKNLEVIIHKPILHDEIVKLTDAELIRKAYDIIQADYTE